MEKEFSNRNLEKSKPDYFYQVEEFVTTFRKDADKTEPFDHVEIFKDNDLQKARTKAVEYYMERIKGIENRSYVLPFASPDDFKPGENSAFSITLNFVEFYNDDESYFYPIMGEDNATTRESIELEREVLEYLGYDSDFKTLNNT